MVSLNHLINNFIKEKKMSSKTAKKNSKAYKSRKRHKLFLRNLAIKKARKIEELREQEMFNA